MSEYTNPSNYLEIVESLKECKNLEEVKDLVMETFPTWVEAIYLDYSLDYPKLRYSYKVFCDAIKQEGKGIVLVNFIPTVNNEPQYTLLTKFLDTMTCSGFIIRRITEFKPCTVCNRLIPTFSIYKVLKFKDPQVVPKEWDIKCANC